MPVLPLSLVQRGLDFSSAKLQLATQWANPGDIFSVLLIVGGEFVGRACAQLAGPRIVPVAFSFGWVAFSLTLAASALGENRMMPLADFRCLAIDARGGITRENSSWVVGRLVRDFDSWKHEFIDVAYREMLDKVWERDRERGVMRGDASVPMRKRAGLCVAVYEAEEPALENDAVFWMSIAVILVQLVIASIPLALYGDWGTLLITAWGTMLSLLTASLAQWRHEKWAAEPGSNRTIILTTGINSKYAIIVLGSGKGYDLFRMAHFENSGEDTPLATRIMTVVLAVAWIILLISATGFKENTWFLLAVGALGIVQNIAVVAQGRSPNALGVPLAFREVIVRDKVMDTLFEVEERYPRFGRYLLGVYFPGELREREEERWAQLAERAASSVAR